MSHRLGGAARLLAVALLAVALLAGAGGAAAQGGDAGPAADLADLVVVELFTSQGCSSCPPADALARQLARRPDVLMLALPVDYWDYLGWKDTLASPVFTRRQRAYVGRLRTRLYTPQMVIDGTADVVGSRRGEVERAIARRAQQLAQAGRVPIRVNRNGPDVMEVEVAAYPRLATAATLWLLHVSDMEAVKIPRGENAGRELTYTHVVREIMPVGSWSGDAARFALPRAATDGGGRMSSALILQGDGNGPILGARWLDAPAP